MYPESLKKLVGIYHPEDGINTIEDPEQNLSTEDIYVSRESHFVDAKFRNGGLDTETARLLLNMRDEAYNQVYMDVMNMVRSKIATREVRSGLIGQNKVGAYLQTAVVPANPFIQIYSTYEPGAYIEIKGIALMLQSLTGTRYVDLRVIKEAHAGDPETVLKTYSIRVNMLSTAVNNVDPIKLPCTGGTYRLEYDFDAEHIRVPDSSYECDCGDKLKDGVHFRLENIGKSYGISVRAEFGCYDHTVLDAMLAKDELRRYIALMVRMKTIELALIRIEATDNVNRQTILDPAAQRAQRDELAGAYAASLAWIGQEKWQFTNSFCIRCGGLHMPFKVNLLTGR